MRHHPLSPPANPLPLLVILPAKRWTPFMLASEMLSFPLMLLAVSVCSGSCFELWLGHYGCTNDVCFLVFVLTAYSRYSELPCICYNRAGKWF